MDNRATVEESIRTLWEATRSDEWSVDSSESQAAEIPAPTSSEDDNAEGKEISAVFSDIEITTMAAPRGQRLRIEGFSSPMASSALFDGFQLYLSTTQEVEEGDESSEEDTSDQENEEAMISTTAMPTPTPAKSVAVEGCTSASPCFATLIRTPTNAASNDGTNVSSPRCTLESVNHPTPIINNRTKSVTWASTPLGRYSS